MRRTIIVRIDADVNTVVELFSDIKKLVRIVNVDGVDIQVDME